MREQPAPEAGEDGEQRLLPDAAAETRPFDITIETGRFVVRMTNMGGEISSIKLLDYPGVDGGPVELIPGGSGGGFSLSIGSGGAVEKMSRIPLRPLVIVWARAV